MNSMIVLRVKVGQAFPYSSDPQDATHRESILIITLTQLLPVTAPQIQAAQLPSTYTNNIRKQALLINLPLSPLGPPDRSFLPLIISPNRILCFRVNCKIRRSVAHQHPINIAKDTTVEAVARNT